MLKKIGKNCHEQSTTNIFRVINSFFMIWSRINKRVCLCLFGRANTRKYAYENSCISLRVFLQILAHLVHLAQSFFSDFKCDKWINVVIQGDHCQMQKSIKLLLLDASYSWPEIIFLYSTMLDVFCVKISWVWVKQFVHNISLKWNRYLQLELD